MLSNYIKITDTSVEGKEELNLGYKTQNVYIAMKPPQVKKKTICLAMIVKNESHLIVQTLTQLTSYIHFDYWVINDNGSTDGTQDLIRNFFKEKNIPGELDETAWRDFAFNRTVVFERAYKKTDYVFVWDADDAICGNFVFPSNDMLRYDNYYFTFGNDSGFRWSRCQLFNNQLRWEYIGVLHEYPSCKEPNKVLVSHTINGDYYFAGRTVGNRSNDSEKYKKDGILLEKAFKEAYEKGDDICNRYAFYAAQSYKDCMMNEKSMEYYKKVLSLNNWTQEKYVSCLEIFTLYEKMDKEDEGLFYLVESYKYDKKRVECIYRLIKYYCIKGMNEVAYAYYTLIKENYENVYLNDNGGCLSEYLFVRTYEYDFYLPYYMIIVSERLKKYDTFAKMYEMIFNKRFLNINDWFIKNLYYNIQFGMEHLPKTDAFLKSIVSYVKLYNSDTIENKHFIENVITHLSS